MMLRGLALFLALALLGAATPLDAPVVAVYPFTVSSGTEPDAGVKVANLLTARLQELGGLEIKTPPPLTERAQYLDAAKALGADYYIAGFLTQIGDQVSLVTQVVSITSGSVIASSTTFPKTYNDAVAQAEDFRAAILRHAGRGYASVGRTEPGPPNTPAPATQRGGVDIGRVFGRKPKGAPASPAPASSPRATPSASARSKPSALAGLPVSALIVEVGGDAGASDRAAAGLALLHALQHAGVPAGQVPISSADALAHAADLCRANAGARELYAAALSIPGDADARPSVELDVTRYDCSGAALGHARPSAPVRRANVAAALNVAAAQAVTALLRATPPAGP